MIILILCLVQPGVHSPILGVPILLLELGINRYNINTMFSTSWGSQPYTRGSYTSIRTRNTDIILILCLVHPGVHNPLLGVPILLLELGIHRYNIDIIFSTSWGWNPLLGVPILLLKIETQI